MSTYEELMIILATASLIVAILNLQNKKVCFAGPAPAKRGYTLAIS